MADSELEKNKKRGKRECIMKGLVRVVIAREGGGGRGVTEGETIWERKFLFVPIIKTRGEMWK